MSKKSIVLGEVAHTIACGTVSRAFPCADACIPLPFNLQANVRSFGHSSAAQRENSATKALPVATLAPSRVIILKQLI
jgi:hypothetical protein